jgi:hypothetical protein
LLRRAAGVGAARPPSAPPLWRTIARTPADYGLLCVTFVLWGTSLFVPVYGLLMLGSGLLLVMALPVWFRQAAGAQVST